MKNTKKLLAFTVAILMITSTFYGCKQTGNKGSDVNSNITSSDEANSQSDGISTDTSSNDNSLDNSSNSTENSATSGSSSAPDTISGVVAGGTSSVVSNVGDKNLEGNTYLTGFPIVKKRESLKVMIVKENTHTSNFDDMSFTKEYERLTNIDIVWELVPSSIQFEKKDTMFNSGNLPDIICLYPNTISAGDVNKYGKEGALINIKPYLAKWAPNANAIMQTKSVMSAIKQIDGSIYTLPTIRNEEYRYWVINKTWLDNLDLSIPKTTDQLYTVLKAFKNDDPNGNGLKDEIPMGGFGWNPAQFGSWGLQMRWYRYASVTTAGKVEFGPATKNFQDGATFYRKLMKEKLFVTTGTAEAHLADLKTGKVGLSLWSWPYNAMDITTAKQYVPMAVPSAINNGAYSSTAVSEFSDGIMNKTYFVTNKCKNIPAAMRWIDYFYTQNGYMLKMYGKEGLNYEVINGRYRVLDPQKNMMKDAPSWVLGGMDKLKEGLFVTKAPTAMTAYEKYVGTFQKNAETIAKAQKPARYIDMENLNFTTAELNIINKYEPDLRKYIIEVAMPSISGILDEKVTIDILANWNGYLQELKKKGMDEFTKVLQDAYNRSQK